MRTHIFGAAAGIGRWFATIGRKKLGQVFAYDTDRKVVNEYAGLNDVKSIHLDQENAIGGDYLQPVFGNVAEGDWIFLAVPEANLEALCKLIKKHIPNRCLVAVMTSRQLEPLALVQSILGNENCCGLHPLFGPTIRTPHGQGVALCYGSNSTPELERLTAALRSMGLSVTRLTPEEHDYQMTYVQALTHFTLLTFSSVISRSGLNWDKLMGIKTPPFQFLSAFSARLLMGNPETYAAIQKSPAAATLRKAFIDVSKNLSDTMAVANTALTVDAIEGIRKPFSGTLLDELSQFSFMADSAVQIRERQYFELQSKEELIVFRTDGVSPYRVGKIIGFDPTTVEIVEVQAKRYEQDGVAKLPIPFDERALGAYKKRGINLKFSSPISVKKSRLQMLTRAESIGWINDNMLLVKRTVSVTNPRNLSEDVFEKWIPKFLPEIKKCEFKESYKKRSEVPKVELVLTYHPSADPEDIRQKIRTFCYNSFDE
jgi:prephenate dehydrogenase